MLQKNPEAIPTLNITSRDPFAEGQFPDLVAIDAAMPKAGAFEIPVKRPANAM
jgi:hypothetical protein